MRISGIFRRAVTIVGALVLFLFGLSIIYAVQSFWNIQSRYDRQPVITFSAEVVGQRNAYIDYEDPTVYENCHYVKKAGSPHSERVCSHPTYRSYYSVLTVKTADGKLRNINTGFYGSTEDSVTVVNPGTCFKFGTKANDIVSVAQITCP